MSHYGLPSACTSYDDEDRLTGFARASGTFTQSWSLTSVGDWNSITTNGTAQNRTHFLTHSRHPYTDCTCPDCSCSTSSSSLSPPASGLLPDFDNKLKSADVDNNGSNDVTFQYDALGRRVARQGTSGSFVYVQHDQQTIADYGYGDAPSSPTHRYVVASYIDEPVVRKAAGTSGTIHYYHRNQQFSITAVTTSSGSVAERYAYTAYGQPTILDSSGSVLSSSAINNRYTYTGREWDQTLGLYHFRARWMSGLAGRFMGRDPIGYRDGFNFYMNYLGMRRVDPSGKGCRVDFECDLIKSITVGTNDYDCVYKCKSVSQTLAGLSGGGIDPITCEDVPDDLEILNTERVDNLDPDDRIEGILGWFCKEKKCEDKKYFWKNYIGRGDIPLFPKCNPQECRMKCDQGEDIVKWLCDNVKEPGKIACEKAARLLNAAGCRVVCDSICKQ
jgi:RHS repeat-associated protein